VIEQRRELARASERRSDDVLVLAEERCEMDSSIVSAGVREADEAAAPAQTAESSGPQRFASDAVDDDVDRPETICPPVRGVQLAAGGAQDLRPLELLPARGRDDDPRAQRRGDLDGEHGRSATGPRYEDGVSRLHTSVGHERAPHRQSGNR
jgi:hypothetical protein